VSVGVCVCVRACVGGWGWGYVSAWVTHPRNPVGVTRDTHHYFYFPPSLKYFVFSKKPSFPPPQASGECPMRRAAAAAAAALQDDVRRLVAECRSTGRPSSSPGAQVVPRARGGRGGDHIGPVNRKISCRE